MRTRAENARRAERVFAHSGCYTSEAYGLDSGHAWDRLAALAGEYVRGERSWNDTARLIDKTTKAVECSARGLVFREQRPGSTIVDTIHCPACKCNGVTLAHVPNSSECIQDRFEREWSQNDD